MRLLLDTHAFLWFLVGHPKLSGRARALIADAANERLLSMASLWELAIKTSLGKLTLGQPFDLLLDAMDVNGIRTLGIESRHIARVATLPFHHRDPFDRMLVAQALEEGIPLISVDANLAAYDIERLW